MTPAEARELHAVARDLGLLTSGPTDVSAAAFIECDGQCTDFCCAGIAASASCIRRAGHRGACQCGG